MALPYRYCSAHKRSIRTVSAIPQSSGIGAFGYCPSSVGPHLLRSGVASLRHLFVNYLRSRLVLPSFTLYGMQKDPETVEFAINKISSKGYGVGFLPQGREIEVAHCVPGDQVRVAWRKKRHGTQKGRLLEILSPSADRTAPLCSHAGVCGGCSWQQMTYEAQLREKEKRVRTAFPGYTVDPILPCETPFGYRNKMEFSFSQNRGGARYLGLMIAQAEPYVFNLSECHLGPSWFAAAVAAVRSWWEAGPLQAYYPPEDSGTLRYLTLREAFRTGQKMAVLNISGRPEFAPSRADLEGFASAIRSAAIPQKRSVSGNPEEAIPVSIFVRIHQAQKGKPTQFYEMLLDGPDHIVEELHLSGSLFSFKISPISFFQTNTLQAEKLYEAALKMIPRPARVVYDLYAGTGTLGMAASRFAEQVVGIELSPEAVLDAEENLKRNRIGNCTVHQGDVGQVIQQLRQNPQFSPPDAALVDPPRAGLDPLALHHLKTLLPRSIVYISCNPITQAANIGELVQAGYALKRLQPIDQFPHTYHIENIAFLER